MKILIVSYPDSLYGANRSLLVLIQKMKDQKIQMLVVVRRVGLFTDTLDNSGIDYLVIPFNPWVSYRWTSRNLVFKWLRDIQQLSVGIIRQCINFILTLKHQKVFRKFDPDVIYSNTILSPFGFYLSRILKVKHVWHIREFLDLDYKLYPDLPRRLFNSLIKLDAVIAISNAVGRHHFGNERGVYNMIYNGVVDSTKIKSSMSDSDNYPFTIVGILGLSKGQEIAIRAVALLKNMGKNVKLNIFGGGSAVHLLEEIKELDIIDQVVFKGFVTNPEIIYKNSCAVLVCSQYEGFGRVTAESMSFGIAVIGRNTIATNELIVNGKNGLLFDGTPKNLAEKMMLLMENLILKHKIIENGLSTVRDNFTNEVYARKVLDVINSLASGVHQ